MTAKNTELVYQEFQHQGKTLVACLYISIRRVGGISKPYREIRNIDTVLSIASPESGIIWTPEKGPIPREMNESLIVSLREKRDIVNVKCI